MKKTLTTSIAALAVAGMIGGGTFADWSSTSDPFAQEAGAGILQLSVTSPLGGHVSFDKLDLMPGATRDKLVHLASSDGASVPDGVLTVKYSTGTSEENGCNGDEKADEITDGHTLCDAASFQDDGEFADYAHLVVAAYKKGADPCEENALDAAYTTDIYDGTLDGALGNEFTVSGITVEPGDEICVAQRLLLGSGANDAMQGDSHSFDVTFVLDQV